MTIFFYTIAILFLVEAMVRIYALASLPFPRTSSKLEYATNTVLNLAFAIWALYLLWRV
jgi:hypothetical protein